jgi:phospholipid-transporting ATPase
VTFADPVLQVIVNEENAHDTKDFIEKRLAAIKNQRNTGEAEDLALIIGMKCVSEHF